MGVARLEIKAAHKREPVLADAAGVLSHQLQTHLKRLSALLGPQSANLEKRFLARLKKIRLDPRQRSSLAAITPGALARILELGHPPAVFFDQVEYNGRRLAKLNLPPSDIAGALEEYDRLLSSILSQLPAEEFANIQWVREQLHFCVILTLNNAYYQVREAETKAFYDLFRVELESRNLDQLLERFLSSLSQFCRSDAAHLFLFNKERANWQHKAFVGRAAGPVIQPIPHSPALMRALTLPRSIAISKEAGVAGKQSANPLLDPSWAGKFATCWSVPLVAGAQLAGVMQFGFRKNYEWLPREQELLAAAAERCLMAAEKAQLMEDLAAREEQVRRLAEHMIHVEEVERRRISRELHDEAGQSMLCIRLALEMIEQALPPEADPVRTKLVETRDITERTIVEVRRLIAALSPAVLEQLGLGAALRQLVTRFRAVHPASVKLHLSRLQNLPKKIELIVYRLVQECCNNIAKHSGATHVNLSAASADGILRLQVEDNGVGFHAEEAFERRDSFGLAGIRERVALLGGKFELESWPKHSPVTGPFPGEKAAGDKAKSRSRPRHGTRIRIELPIPRDPMVRDPRMKDSRAKDLDTRPRRLGKPRGLTGTNG